MTPQILIQCAGKKNNTYTFDNYQGKKVEFISDIESNDLPNSNNSIYVNPNEAISEDSDKTWIDKLKEYNKNKLNPNGFCQAWELYENPIYADIKKKVGKENMFIASAGWGIVKASYWLPNYDITFSRPPKGKKKNYIIRSSAQNEIAQWDDINAFHDSNIKIYDLHIFCGKKYLRLINKLITDRQIDPNMITLYIRNNEPNFNEWEIYCKLIKWTHPDPKKDRNTNWHYDCAEDFINKLR